MIQNVTGQFKEDIWLIMLELLPKISIIVPIHNTPGPILNECLFCLTHQQYNNYEVICVDDCSGRTDTIEIERQYVNEFSNIVRLFCFKENLGAAEARNFGLDNAGGEYCIFLDSDDIFSTDFLVKLYAKITENDSDLCLCEYSLFKEEEERKTILNRIKLDFEFKDIEGKENMLLEIPASGCNRLCKMSYLKNNGIKFQSLKSDNDMYFALKSILCTNKISILHDYDLMLYRFNTDFQISANMNPLNMMCAISKLLSEIENIPLYDNVFSMIACYSVFTGIFEMRNCKTEDNARTFYNHFRKELIETFPVLENKRCNLYIDYWINNEFESKWFDTIGDYIKQLQTNTVLADRIKAFHLPVFIWGRGKRGNAFEQWSKDQNIQIKGICDRKNCDLGKEDEFGIEIMSTTYIKSSKGLIIATNHEIYDSLSNSSDDLCVIDLEKFCPL